VKLACPVLCQSEVGLSSFVSLWSWLVQFCVSVKLAFPVLCHCEVGLSSIVSVWSWLVQFYVSVKLACPVLCQCEVGLSSIVSVWSWLVQFYVSVKLAFPVSCHCEVGLSSIVSVWSWLVQFCVIVKWAFPVLCQCEVGLLRVFSRRTVSQWVTERFTCSQSCLQTNFNISVWPWCALWITEPSDVAVSLLFLACSAAQLTITVFAVTNSTDVWHASDRETPQCVVSYGMAGTAEAIAE